ncbi:MAG TPA: nucleotidyltransferase domain-containing protein [Longimicrobiaceae bacterium]|nr:nucleotidyltransferase domain-containing protein [Longimicrobiaceae bacterium]
MLIRDPDLALLVAEAADAYAASQAELAAAAGVRPLALTTWRRGSNRPTAEHLRSLAAALETRAERLSELAERLHERAAMQGKLTRRRRTSVTDREVAQMWASRLLTAGGGDVVRVVFYGSRARGAPRSPSSDWDFIVVVKRPVTDSEAAERWFRSAAVNGPSPVADARMDLWVMSVEEWETARSLVGHPARAADQEGLVLYAAE